MDTQENLSDNKETSPSKDKQSLGIDFSQFSLNETPINDFDVQSPGASATMPPWEPSNVDDVEQFSTNTSDLMVPIINLYYFDN